MFAAALFVSVVTPVGSSRLSAPASVAFRRTFSANSKSSYTYKTGPHGEKDMFICQYTELVTALKPDGASIDFNVTKLDMPGLGASDPVPPLTSKVGPDNMPGGASLKDSTEFLIFGSVTGITPNKSANVGDTVKVHWENDSKDVSFDAIGKLKTLDSAAKTLAVSWNIEMKPSYTTGGKFKLISTYALADFSLIKSVGTFTIGQTVMDVSVTLDTP